MTDIFERLLSEVEKFPSAAATFVQRDVNGSAYEKTWEQFSYGYSAAFEVLARKCLEPDTDLGLLSSSLFYLARHSVELALKGTLDELSKTDATERKEATHSLASLWEHVNQSMELCGMGRDDEWGLYCGKLIAQMHENDPDGERFRYPSNRQGQKFELTKLDVEELVRAQWHITMYLDACYEMHCEGYRSQ